MRKIKCICGIAVVALLLGVCNDLFTYPEKYMPTLKYHLENRINRGDTEAIKYYNDVYIANGVKLFE